MTDLHANGMAAALFDGPGELRARCREHDWAATPLGPVEAWPPALRVAAPMVVAAGLPNIVLWGRQLIQIYNDAYAAIIRDKHPYALGRGNREVWPEVWHINEPVYERVFAGETVVLEDTYYPLERRDAAGGWALEDAYLTVAFSPIRDETGAVAGVLANMLETTRLVGERQARAALVESEARHRLALDAAQIGTWTWDMATDAATFDARVRELFAFDHDEPWPRVEILATRLHPDDRERVAAALAAAADPAGDGRYEAEYRVVRPDGSERWARAAGRMHFAGEGAARRPVRLIGTVLDVTASMHARQEIARLLGESEAARRAAEEARAAADAANQAKTDFLATMSHELRTPLNAIGGYAELLELGIHGPLTAPQREAIGRIQRSQRHLTGLISDVLNFAKLEAGRVEYRLEAVPVAAALDALEPLVALQLRAKALRYERPPCDAPDAAAAVCADADKLQQILVNLLSNAIKFTPPGGTVALLCECTSDTVRLAVRDTGIGIAPERLEEVFAPFVQVDRRLHAPHEGTGLGLAISRDLARGMRGELTVESVPGEGSTFTLTLPRG